MADRKAKSYEHKVKKDIKQEVKKEERLIFKEFVSLKRKHQAIFALIMSVGFVFISRGLMNLMDNYWFPSLSLFSNLSGILIGVLLLFFSHQIIKQLVH